MKKYILMLMAGLLLSGIIIGCAQVNSSSNPSAQDYGTLTGQVTKTSGTALSGVTVTAGGSTATTNDQGWFAFTSVAASSSLPVTFSLFGYVNNQKIVTIINGRETYITCAMQASGTAQNLVVANGGAITEGSTTVTFPANCFTNADGSAYTGTTAKVTLTPGSFASTMDADAFPGTFSGEYTTGVAVSFESFGWTDIKVVDTVTGAALKGKAGVQWTLVIPNAAGTAPSETSIPMWYYSESEAKWKAAVNSAGTQINAIYISSSDTFIATLEGGNFAGDPWNVDRPFSSVSYIKGRVVDSAGNPISNANVKVWSARNNWRGGDYTGSNGIFGPIAITPNQAAKLQALKGAKTSAITDISALSPATYTVTSPFDVGDIVLDSPQIQFTLTWGVDPADLDSHLTIPKEISTSAYRYHLYYSNYTTTPSTAYPYAALDTDDTSSYGPEHTTVYQLYEGSYRFCVHHYAGSSDIEHSSARVDLNVDDGTTVATYTFTPPSGQPADKPVWQVCDIAVNSSGKITGVTTLNSYGDQSKATYDPNGDPDQVYTTATSQIKMVK